MEEQIALYIDHNYQRQTHLCHKIKTMGFEIHKASTVEDARKKIQKNIYNLIVMHHETMKNDVFDFCSFVRSGNLWGVIMVLMTNVKINVEEKLFDLGANDIVAGKQTSTNILAKRIKSHLTYCKKPKSIQTNTIKLKDTIINFDSRKVWCNGTIRKLPGILVDLLKYFIDNSNRIISREELLNSPIWADSICSSAKEGGKTFDVNVGKLRKIIEPDPTHPQIITSVRGAGWILETDFVK